MSLRAPRWLGILFLSGLMASAITTIASATTHHRRHHHSSASGQLAGTRHHRARRAPPGGCWARCAIVIDPASGEVLYDKNSQTAAPIASLSKLMTAMVFLDQQPDLTRGAVVTREELTGAGHTQLRNGETVALGDLLHMSLMCSDNCATRVLARESGLSAVDFQARMNHKAAELGMSHTEFVECTGLDQRNVSTAADVARMLHAAATVPLIHEISTTREYAFSSPRREHEIRNTDRLLYSQRYEVLGGKTGFISEAGYCFATWIRTEGRDLIAVVLGAPTAATRFADTSRLVQRVTSASIAQP
jgi:serine-type D-Ala-D-Ala endopeptidase (penicillin-binding protein 7)